MLGPGDVFVNADFGYQPTTAQVGSIGDTVWFDANANSAQDGSETGIPGVTVSLIKDLGTIGVYEPGIDLIIATDITDAAGQYLFNGLPASGTEDYLVWVNDTNNVLGDLVPTYDATAPANGLSSVQNLTTIPVTNQDFGYAPVGQTTGEGLIGDTIFADRDLGNDYDPGEGLEGVVVRLYSDTNGDGNYDAGEPLLSATVTDENGKYSFGNLPPGNYVVAVDTTTLPGTLTNSVDPGGNRPAQRVWRHPGGGGDQPEPGLRLHRAERSPRHHRQPDLERCQRQRRRGQRRDGLWRRDGRPVLGRQRQRCVGCR